MKGGPRATLGAILPLAIMLLLAMLTLWLDRTVELTTAAAVPRTVTHEPDYIVEKFNLQRLSADGEPRYRLSAARMGLHLAYLRSKTRTTTPLAWNAASP